MALGRGQGGSHVTQVYRFQILFDFGSSWLLPYSVTLGKVFHLFEPPFFYM